MLFRSRELAVTFSALPSSFVLRHDKIEFFSLSSNIFKKDKSKDEGSQIPSNSLHSVHSVLSYSIAFHSEIFAASTVRGWDDVYQQRQKRASGVRATHFEVNFDS